MGTQRYTTWICLCVLSCVTLSSSQENMLKDNFLLVASNDGSSSRILQLDIDEEDIGKVVVPLQLSAQQSPVGVTYDPRSKKVYWSDRESRSIKRAFLNGSSEERIVELVQDSIPEGVAVDPVAGLMFYADGGRGTINLQTLAGRQRKTVVQNIRFPRTVRVDPLYRRIYWSDWGTTPPRIESSSYDGSDRTTLVNYTGLAVGGFDIDTTERRLYWTDLSSGSVFQSSIQGTDRTRLYQYDVMTQPVTSSPSASAHFYGLVKSGEFIYFTNRLSSSIYRVRTDGSDPQPKNVTSTYFKKLFGLAAYESYDYKPGSQSECNERNGGCSDICIPVLEGVKCACADNKRLGEDEKSCSQTEQSNGPDLVWSEWDGQTTGWVRGITGMPDDYLTTKEVRTWSIRSPAWHWTAADIDYKNNYLYLVDRIDKFVVRMTLNGTKEINVVYYGTSSQVNGIAYDWISGNLYWTDALYNWIMMAKAELKTNHTRAIVRTGLERPHGIAVYPQKRYLFWTEWGMEPKLERSDLLGNNREVLVNTNLRNPTGVAVDFDKDRVYWSNRDLLESVQIHGSDRRVHGGTTQNNFVDISVFQNYLFATDKGRSGNEYHLWFYNTERNENGIKLGLSREPHGVVMYHEDRQPADNSPCLSAGCEHLCVTEGATVVRCVCSNGFTLNADGKTCAGNNSYHGPAYIFSIGDQLCSASVKHATSRLNQEPSYCFFSKPDHKYDFHALDFNFYSGEVIFSDIRSKVPTIRRANMNMKQNNSVIVYGPGRVEGVAVDWINNNLYWTEGDHGQLWVSRLDGSYQRILLKTRSVPKALVLDPIRRYLYWIEYEEPSPARPAPLAPTIWRCRPDGKNVSRFLTNHLNKPSGLALNFRDERLYWVNGAGAAIIQSIGFDGRGRKVHNLHIPSNLQPFDIALMQDYAVLSVRDQTRNRSGIQVFELETGIPVRTEGILHPGHPRAYDVIAMDEHNQPIQRDNTVMSCHNEGNRLCEQLCLPSERGYTCACVDGQTLAADKLSCVPLRSDPDEFLLIADDYRHQVYMTNQDGTRVSAVKFPAFDRPIGLTFDVREDRLYWTDFHQSFIRRSYLDGTGLETLYIYRNETGARIDGLAFEPESRLLYYTDMGRNLIGITTPSGSYHKVLLRSNNLTQLRAIVLDPDHGYMYFGSQGKIERADMDGLARRVVVSNVSWPSGIALDKANSKLYWVDHGSEKLERSGLEGENREVVYTQHESADPFSVTVWGGNIYWSDWNIRGLNRIGTNRQGLTVLHPDYFTGLNDVKYVNKKVPPKPNPCSTNNGGCSHFCIPNPSGFTCACPDNEQGEVLPVGLYECKDVPRCPSGLPNGQLEKTCTREAGKACEFTCYPGYGATQIGALTCGRDQRWSLDLRTLCSDVTCDKLITPPNAEKVAGCPGVVSVGVSCEHRCRAGYRQEGGHTARECRPDLTWSGRPLQCVKDDRAPPVAKPGASTSGESSGGGSLTPMIAGLAAGCALIGIIILVIAFIMCRRRRRRDKGSHSEFVNPFPATPPPGASPPTSPSSPPSPVYDVANDTVALDGSMAFDNPAYASLKDVNQSRKVGPTDAGPLPQKPPLDASLDEPDLNQNKGRTAFENPMYERTEISAPQDAILMLDGSAGQRGGARV